jgi:hypothetical protein
MDAQREARREELEKDSPHLSRGTWDSQEFLRHVESGRAVLGQYFKVVDELHRREREAGILRSELEFMIHFIERLVDEEDNAALRVVLGRLRTALNAVDAGQPH